MVCFAVLPESFVFGTIALLAPCLVLLSARRGLWAQAAAACFRATVTNLGAFAAMAIAAARRGARRAELWRSVRAAVLGVAAVAAVFVGNERRAAPSAACASISAPSGPGSRTPTRPRGSPRSSTPWPRRRCASSRWSSARR
jgi:hypothetical protein